MAESNTRTRRRSEGEGRAQRDSSRRDDGQGAEGGRKERESSDHGDGRRPIPALRLVESAKSQLMAMTGKVAESTSGVVERDGGWCVTVEMVELERIPPTTSILGSYQAQIDRDGNVVAFERVRRYSRSEADG